jgi:probable HAF family extracellular repeat protein
VRVGRITVVIAMWAAMTSCTTARCGESGSAYNATMLPGIDGGEIAARGLSDLGVVVGAARTHVGTWHAVEWVAGATRELDPTWRSSVARSIDDSGIVVGDVDVGEGQWRAAAFENSGTTLLPFAGGFLATRAVAIYGGRYVAIDASSSNPANNAAFVADREDGWKLREFGRESGYESIHLTWIGSKTRAVGSFGGKRTDGRRVSVSGTRTAFVAGDEGIRTLGTLGGLRSEATSANDDGVVVGWSEIAQPEPGGWGRSRRAFVFVDGKMKDLGTLGGRNSWALSVGVDNTVVGGSEDGEARRRAFVWKHGKMADLNALVGSFAECVMEEAVDINSKGQVVANGTETRRVGRKCSVLLTPSQSASLSARAELR